VLLLHGPYRPQGRIDSADAAAVGLDRKREAGSWDVAAEDGALHPIQQAFKECHALQCGFCTPGMVMKILSRFEESEPLDLSKTGIRDMLSGNLCRCTGYINIIAVVRRAAELLGRA
jgi:aerobic-type carbon monoxide dehydrogenase small subunit (CoxS/CutS family)